LTLFAYVVTAQVKLNRWQTSELGCLAGILAMSILVDLKWGMLALLEKQKAHEPGGRLLQQRDRKKSAGVSYWTEPDMTNF
jgi:hypothetical protein